MDDKTELIHAINTSIENVNCFDIGMVLYALYKNVFVVTSIKNKIWFQFKDHKWIKTDCGPYKELSTRVVTLYRDALRKLNRMKHKDESKIVGCEKIICMLHDINVKERICRECLYIFFDDSFVTKLDQKPHLIPFANGVYDYKSNSFRDGKYDDYLSIYINDQFEDIEGTIDKLINEFNEFRSNVVIKRKSGFVYIIDKLSTKN